LEGPFGGEKREILINKDGSDGTKNASRRSQSKVSCGNKWIAVLRLLQKVIQCNRMPTITVKLSKPEFAKLEATAAVSRRTKSEIVREALARSTRRSASLLDAMRPYVGKLSGPGDLSTNKSRMKGYGTSRSR
jgi:hypothetical protein